MEETRTILPPIHNWLGVGSAGTGEPIDASIDRVRIHQAILTPEELDSVASTPKALLESTLIAFNFDEGNPPYASSGTINRSTVFAQDVVIADSAPTFTESPSRDESDTAIAFDGNDRVIVEDPNQVLTLDETQDFTIQAWLKPGAQVGSKGVFFFSNGPGGAISAAITQAGNVMVTTLGRADTTTDAVFPNDGLWHHLGIIHENGVGYTIYIDGILEATTPYTAGVLTEARLDTFFVLGAESSGGLAYTGELDRLEFLNEAISPSDLDYLAVPGVDPGSPELAIETAVSISWPTLATGFQLQSSTDLNEPRTWTEVNAQAQVFDDKFHVLLPATELKTYYRLVRPTTGE